MPDEDKEETTSVNLSSGDGPGCGWWVIVLIVCVTIYNVAELYFAHKH